MCITTLTAARIYAVGEDGQLPIDQLPESAFVRTFSKDAQVTDSAPSMGGFRATGQSRVECPPRRKAGAVQWAVSSVGRAEDF